MTAVTACAACGTEPLENARFCHGCGSAVADPESRAEYKQVTVLFADVVHSMDLAASLGAERLREIMAALVNRSVGVVERFGGTVDKFTGDGIMAVFGAPVALEDHAVRGCLAALGIQQQATQLAAEIQRRDRTDFSLRIGLNSGEVIAGEVASHAMGYTSVGEHVGLAQRMESTAPPGGVMLSDSTARLVENVAVLSDPQMVHVKGSDDSVAAHRLLGMETPHAITGTGETRLVGRHWEMAAIEANLERSMEGDGAAVALVGPAGIGKSRLVREIVTTAVGRDADVFWAFCESHASDIPFHAAAQLLRAAAGLPELGDDAVRARLRDRFADADEQDLVLFDDFLGIRHPDTALPNIDPDARRRRLSGLVKAAAIARSTPAIYIIEDVHWVDEASDAMLADLMTVIPQTHSMVLLTHRPEFRGALTRVPGAQTLTLAPLSNRESATLAQELLGEHSSVRELASAITTRAGGNPFFAQEIVRDLAERDVLRGRRGAYTCDRDVADVNVPATLQATIAARIDRLDPPAKRTLCAASVIGMRFDDDLLASIGVDPVLDELLRAELIDQVKFTGHAEFAFRHPLIRTVAYESQLKADRAALHRQLANAIESQADSLDENAALIAEHLEAAGDLRAAYRWHMRAAASSQGRDIAAALLSWDRAARLADGLPDDDADRLAMRIAPRTLWCANGWRVRKPIAGNRFEELDGLCATAGDKSSIAIATMGLLGECLFAGRLADASRLAGEYMTLIQSIGDPALTVGLTIGPAAAKLLTGEMADVRPWCADVIDLAEGDRAMGGYVVKSPLAAAYGMHCTASWWLGHTGWRDDFDHALAMARDADPVSRAVAVTYTYANAISCGVIAVDDLALRDIDDALQSAERAADDLALATALYVKASALWNLGPVEHQHAVNLLRRFHDMAVAGRYYPFMLPVAEMRFAEERIRDGDRGAVPLIVAGLDEAYDSGLLSYCPWGTDMLVKALLEVGTEKDIQDAGVALDRLSAVPQLDGSVFRDLILLRLWALVARARGDEAGFRDFATRYRDMAVSLGFAGHMAIAESMVGADGIEPPTAGV
jgi:class 3 adenylate cyclase